METVKEINFQTTKDSFASDKAHLKGKLIYQTPAFDVTVLPFLNSIMSKSLLQVSPNPPQIEIWEEEEGMNHDWL